MINSQLRVVRDDAGIFPLSQVISIITSEVGGVVRSLVPGVEGHTTTSNLPSVIPSSTPSHTRKTPSARTSLQTPGIVIPTIPSTSTPARLTKHTRTLPTTTSSESNSRDSTSSTTSINEVKTSLTSVFVIPSSTALTTRTQTSRSLSITPRPSVGTNASSSNSSHDAQRRAIIGGLCGAIAGLIFIGFLIGWCLRRRGKRRGLYGSNANIYDRQEPEIEKIMEFLHPKPYIGPRTTVTALLTDQSKPLPPPPPEIHRPRSRAAMSTPDNDISSRSVDSQLIRVPLKHWPRPFRPGEGIRESLGPGCLRVVNPDRSLNNTPDNSPGRPPIRIVPGSFRQVRPRDGNEVPKSIVASFHSPSSSTGTQQDSASSDRTSTTQLLPSSLQVHSPTNPMNNSALLQPQPNQTDSRDHTLAPGVNTKNPFLQHTQPPPLTPPVIIIPTASANGAIGEPSPLRSDLLQPPPFHAITKDNTPRFSFHSIASSRNSSVISDPFYLDAGRSTERLGLGLANTGTEKGGADEERAWQMRWAGVGVYEGT